MKISLYNRLLRYFRKNPSVWIAGGQMEIIVKDKTNFMGSTTTRKLRLLAEDGYLEVKKVRGSSHYKLKDLEV